MAIVKFTRKILIEKIDLNATQYMLADLLQDHFAVEREKQLKSIDETYEFLLKNPFPNLPSWD